MSALDYLAILGSGIGCPTCGHSLAAPCGHCGEEESHVRRRSQSEAQRVLRAIYGVLPTADLDAALIEQGLAPRPAHRPRQGAEPRIVRSYRVDPVTAKAIAAEAKRSGESQGQVVDRLAKGIK